ncbi:hypothetical protein OEZ86_009543 [Tetradesmus obliquus]|uniref:RRM domain-containing protein n=1 Tax=Tetradesmus obliquus TaxID=3088 RepID=A0ABY8ULZ2_TETOB|nr:hypothetical protein OEZ85_000988 [Tetradesmus obliquus]WIA43008.1 hypothetical protein OEZ86_009543 [Tetradesmus obliquus]
MQAAKGIKAPSLTVFLGNLDSKVTERHIYELGCQAGPVQHVKVQHDSDTNKKGFGFITYADLDSAIYCLGLYRGLLHLFGLPVNVNFANREVPAEEISEQHTALLEKAKRMLLATGAELHIPGAGPARRQQQQSQRYTPYGAPQSRHTRDKQQQQQHGAGGNAGNGYDDGDSSYQDRGGYNNKDSRG